MIDKSIIRYCELEWDTFSHNLILNSCSDNRRHIDIAYIQT